MENAGKISSFLGKGFELEGVLKITGTFRIDGNFRGEISGEGILFVGEEARIESDIHVSKLYNSGEIHGNVITDEKIEISATGKVIGSIKAPLLIMKKGGIIEGNIKINRMENKDEMRMTALHADKSVTSL